MRSFTTKKSCICEHLVVIVVLNVFVCGTPPFQADFPCRQPVALDRAIDVLLLDQTGTSPRRCKNRLPVRTQLHELAAAGFKQITLAAAFAPALGIAGMRSRQGQG